MGHKINLTIGCLAKELGICTETIQYYHRIGLLPVPQCIEGGKIRLYTGRDMQLLKFIKRAQRLGFSLEETRSLVELSHGKNCDRVRPIAEQKLTHLNEKIADMINMRDTISQLLEGCERNYQNAECPIIDALMKDQLPFIRQSIATTTQVKHGPMP